MGFGIFGGGWGGASGVPIQVQYESGKELMIEGNPRNHSPTEAVTYCREERITRSFEAKACMFLRKGGGRIPSIHRLLFGGSIGHQILVGKKENRYVRITRKRKV